MKEYIKDVRDQMVCLMVEHEYDDIDICEVFNISKKQIQEAEKKQKSVFYPIWIKNNIFKENRKRKCNLRKRDTVYFIKQDIPNGLIKIGFTSGDVNRRKDTLQTSSPYKLVILKTIDGEYSLEFEIHEKFKHLRASGEWFYPHKELLSFIEKS